MEARRSTGAEAAAAAADVERYRAEEKALQTKAEDLESTRNAIAKHGPPLGFAIALLQIAIALASVCFITRRKQLWVISGLLGAIGITYIIYGLDLVWAKASGWRWRASCASASTA